MRPFLKLQTVDIKFLPQVWPMAEEYIKSAVKYTEDYNADQIKVFLSTGAWTLFVMVDELQQLHGAATVSIENGPNHRTAVVTTVGGKNVITPEIVEQFHYMLRHNGVTRVHCYARPSAARLYKRVGFKDKATLMEMKL